MTEDQSVKDQAVSLADLEEENQTLYPKLTKRNQDFIFQFNKEMKAQGAEEAAIRHENTMIKEMLDKQGQGITANHLYGTPIQYVQQVLYGPSQVEAEPATFQQLWLDSALFIGGMFAALAGIGAISSNQEANSQSFGLVTLIINFVLGGLAMAILTYYQQNMDRDAKHPILRYIGVGAAVVIAWIGVVSLSTILIPASINIVLPAFLYFAIAVIAFVGRWWYKKTYNIQTNTLF
ncbi:MULTISPECIES: DUF1129 domain-containing protein [Aerococcus]|uniref:DUF1129 family protein n=2 Tax=Lactobacillales TaxID=186826 RepID=A0A5N1GLL7_9LACT|nr:MULTISPECIES: DUF1129 family protein [Aerococcus]KAA9301119.1 DUF1129 family protein [Aerococcus sanguinicola]MDK6369355.1 DUF1129 family protein [Aerococcus sp. UMB9870]MDK6679181.1 DUF1129 family protein [Aerococcus sp. UMB8608]MDK6687135.1 DUF1129 family protein [Aerococcus sp. UMB8623]MDK6940693.1 DUF1129 family protein [Aerococcus sp. UMB8487]